MRTAGASAVLVAGLGKPVAGGAGLDDGVVEGEPVDDRGAEARGPVKVSAQPEKEWLEAIATEFFCSRSVRTWKRNYRPRFRRETGECGFVDLLVSYVSRAYVLGRRSILREDVGNARHGNGGLMAQCPSRGRAVTEHHGRLDSVTQRESGGVGEQAVARILKAREDDEAEGFRALRATPRCSDDAPKSPRGLTTGTLFSGFVWPR